MPPQILTERGDRLAATALYGILRLRAEVFVVEQECVYLDLDGADLLESTTHLWAEDGDGGVIACARVLDGGAVIGRVVTAAAHRKRGVGAAIVTAALDVAARPVRANAQAHLCDWYERLGFEIDGDEFLEDGIPHLPMVVRAG